MPDTAFQHFGVGFRCNHLFGFGARKPPRRSSPCSITSMVGAASGIEVLPLLRLRARLQAVEGRKTTCGSETHLGLG